MASSSGQGGGDSAGTRAAGTAGTVDTAGTAATGAAGSGAPDEDIKAWNEMVDKGKYSKFEKPEIDDSELFREWKKGEECEIQYYGEWVPAIIQKSRLRKGTWPYAHVTLVGMGGTVHGYRVREVPTEPMGRDHDKKWYSLSEFKSFYGEKWKSHWDKAVKDLRYQKKDKREGKKTVWFTTEDHRQLADERRRQRRKQVAATRKRQTCDRNRRAEEREARKKRARIAKMMESELEKLERARPVEPKEPKRTLRAEFLDKWLSPYFSRRGASGALKGDKLGPPLRFAAPRGSKSSANPRIRDAEQQARQSYAGDNYAQMASDTHRMMAYRAALELHLKRKWSQENGGIITIVDIGTGALALWLRAVLDIYRAHERNPSELRLYGIEVGGNAAARARAVLRKEEVAFQKKYGPDFSLDFQVVVGYSTRLTPRMGPAPRRRQTLTEEKDTIPKHIDILVQEILGDIASSEGVEYVMKDFLRRWEVDCVVPEIAVTRAALSGPPPDPPQPGTKEYRDMQLRFSRFSANEKIMFQHNRAHLCCLESEPDQKQQHAAVEVLDFARMNAELGSSREQYDRGCRFGDCKYPAENGAPQILRVARAGRLAGIVCYLEVVTSCELPRDKATLGSWRDPTSNWDQVHVFWQEISKCAEWAQVQVGDKVTVSFTRNDERSQLDNGQSQSAKRTRGRGTSLCANASKPSHTVDFSYNGEKRRVEIDFEEMNGRFGRDWKQSEMPHTLRLWTWWRLERDAHEEALVRYAKDVVKWEADQSSLKQELKELGQRA